jgi:8-oxo-dGTP pyrophosphatase MutT (NUDIX family)
MAKLIAASSIIICCPSADGGCEVLMVKRPKNMSYGGALVFPGGKLDICDLDPNWNCFLSSKKNDASSRDLHLRIAGIREVFEETGILLADTPIIVPSEERKEMQNDPNYFISMCKAKLYALSVSELHPVLEWVAPPQLPIRFHLHLYIYFVPTKIQVLPDGVECIDAFWIKPAEALEMFSRNEIILYAPQYYMLYTIASMPFEDIKKLPLQRAIPELVPIGQTDFEFPSNLSYTKVRMPQGYEWKYFKNKL